MWVQVQEEYVGLLERFHRSYVSVWAAKHHVLPATISIASQSLLMLAALSLLAAATETGSYPSANACWHE